jgi:hypothetical protein
MRKTETREIGGHTYEIQQLGARKGNEVLERVMAFLAGPLGEVVKGLGTKEATLQAVGDLSGDALAGALKDAAGRLDGGQLNWVVDQLAPSIKLVSPENSEIKISLGGAKWDDQFAGAYKDQLSLVGEAFAVNFSDFLPSLASLRDGWQKLVTPTAAKSNSSRQPARKAGRGRSRSTQGSKRRQSK